MKGSAQLSSGPINATVSVIHSISLLSPDLRFHISKMRRELDNCLIEYCALEYIIDLYSVPLNCEGIEIIV